MEGEKFEGSLHEAWNVAGVDSLRFNIHRLYGLQLLKKTQHQESFLRFAEKSLNLSEPKFSFQIV